MLKKGFNFLNIMVLGLLLWLSVAEAQVRQPRHRPMDRSAPVHRAPREEKVFSPAPIRQDTPYRVPRENNLPPLPPKVSPSRPAVTDTGEVCACGLDEDGECNLCPAPAKP